MKLNKIKISGTTYDVGGSNVIELTQAEYDALVDIDPTALYVITDATEVDINNYYTKTETNTLLGGKQDTLVSGTNIKTVNNESILGSGNIDIQSGKELVGGTNISVSTGATADTIDCTLPMSASTNGGIILDAESTASYGSIVSGYKTNAPRCSIAFGYSSDTKTSDSIIVGQYSQITNPNGSSRFSFGQSNIVSTYGIGALGNNLISNAMSEISLGVKNISRGENFIFGGSGDTFFTVGNGNYSTRHNAFEIRQNGDIYVPDTDDTSTSNYYEKPMLRLQDYMRRKPVVLYETDGTTGLLGLNESSYGTDNYQLTDMDFTPYKYLKCYIKPSVDTVADSAKSPAVVVEVPLDDAASSGSYYMGAQEVIYPFNRNRHFACGVAVDPTKTKLKFVYETTLWDISVSDANAAADGRYLYKIVGYYD